MRCTPRRTSLPRRPGGIHTLFNLHRAMVSPDHTHIMPCDVLALRAHVLLSLDLYIEYNLHYGYSTLLTGLCCLQPTAAAGGAAPVHCAWRARGPCRALRERQHACLERHRQAGRPSSPEQECGVLCAHEVPLQHQRLCCRQLPCMATLPWFNCVLWYVPDGGGTIML